MIVIPMVVFDGHCSADLDLHGASGVDSLFPKELSIVGRRAIDDVAARGLPPRAHDIRGIACHLGGGRS